MDFIIYGFILLYAVSLIASIRVMYKNDLVKYTRYKMTTSSLFILIGLMAFLISNSELYLYFLPGYIFCFLGDLFLAIAKTPSGILKKKKFLFGLVSFGLAHGLYINSIAKMLNGKVGWYFILFTISGFLFVFTSYKRDKYEIKGKLIIPCFIYATLVSTFLGMTFTYLIRGGINRESILLFIGSLCFMVSDMILSFKYFGKEKKKWYILVELVLYYIAMLLLSVFFVF